MQKKSMLEGITLPAILFAIVAVVAIPLRTYQYFSNIEASTGFYIEKDAIIWVLYALMAVCFVFSVGYSFIKSKAFVLDFKHERRLGCGILSALLAVLTLGDALRCFNRTFDLRLDFILEAQYPDMLEPERAKIVESVVNLEGLTAIAAAVFFIVSAISFISGKSVAEKFRLLSLTPVIWCVARIVYRFSITISYLRVSQLTIEMFMLILDILFFMTYAQTNSKVNAKGLEWKLIAYGFPAALLSLLSFIPQFIVLVADKKELLYMYSVPCYCDFAIALFILSILISRIRVKGTDEAEIAETASEETAETEEESTLEEASGEKTEE